MFTFAQLHAAASVLYGDRGAWAYGMWAAINHRFWDGQLVPGPIHWGLTAGCNFGWFLGHGRSGQITIHEALTGTDFDDWVMADRSQARSSWNRPPSDFGIGTALGTLLHESMHQAHHQRGLEYGTDRLGNREGHHCQTWVDECARIAPLIGLPTRTWPVYIERKESIDEVFNRLERAGGRFDPNNFTRAALANRRQWVQVPTINGEAIDLADWDGPPLAAPGEITMFPRATYERMGLAPADRVDLILKGPITTTASTAPVVITAAEANQANQANQLPDSPLTPSDNLTNAADSVLPLGGVADPLQAESIAIAPSGKKRTRSSPLADRFPKTQQGLDALLAAIEAAGSMVNYGETLGISKQSVSGYLKNIRNALAAAE